MAVLVGDRPRRTARTARRAAAGRPRRVRAEASPARRSGSVATVPASVVIERPAPACGPARSAWWPSSAVAIGSSTSMITISGAASSMARSTASLQRHRRRRAPVAAAEQAQVDRPDAPRRGRAARRRRRGRRGTAAPSPSAAVHSGRQVLGVQAVHEQQAADQLVVDEPVDQLGSLGARRARRRVPRPAP